MNAVRTFWLYLYPKVRKFCVYRVKNSRRNAKDHCEMGSTLITAQNFRRKCTAFLPIMRKSKKEFKDI